MEIVIEISVRKTMGHFKKKLCFQYASLLITSGFLLMVFLAAIFFVLKKKFKIRRKTKDGFVEMEESVMLDS
ncbi:hypothetical protein CAEBREN_11705 [Caenorhabditis brenneri]|uniref:Uncharacterized protein n=1 Tax=Caenorhabditis brenneri TaxID=135651 RepID=G0MDK2_CAEBE|nr:hypothetical protein CAEBREN_11705 [Caenorhabditis brenneri]